MNLKKFKNSKAGFTLIEVVAVLVVLGILAAVAIPKYVDLTTEARAAALNAAVAELNGREAVAWATYMVSTVGTPVDATVFTAAGQDLGPDYSWFVAPTVSGGTIDFRGAGINRVLTRAVGTTLKPARWN